MLSIFEERNVRMIWNPDCTEIWFSAIDVGEELGIINIRDTLRNIDRTEKKKFKNEEISGVGVLYTRNFDSPLNNYGETFVSEEAVYNMSFRSNKPEAKLFTKWVTKVLKQIRVNGYFVTDEESNKWLKTRTETKQVRRMETDTIKRFVEYAKSQGSTHAEQYYMNLFFDCEFTGLRKDTTLISIGIVATDGRKFYAEFCDYDRKQCDEWILKNVISNLYLSEPMFEGEAQEFVRINSIGKRKTWIPYERPKSAFITTNKKENLNEKVCLIFNAVEDENGNRNVFGDREWVALHLKEWLSQFDSVQFISDVCHYDFVLLIDLFGTAFDLPENVCPACRDINQDIAKHYGISEREAFDKSREEIVMELCGHEVEGRKHNALYDAEVIKRIYERIIHLESINTFSDSQP